MHYLLDEIEEEKAQERDENTQLLRIICWLLFAILSIGGTYIYFNPW